MGRHILRPAVLELLARIVAEPGEHTVAELAKLLGASRTRTAKRVHSLARASLLEPRLYRIFPSGRVGFGDDALGKRIFGVLVENGPLTRADLCRLLGIEKTGEFTEAVAQAAYYGWLLTPQSPLPSLAGVEYVLELRPELGEGHNGAWSGGWAPREAA